MAFSNTLAGAYIANCSNGKSALGRKRDGKFRGWGAGTLTGVWRLSKAGEPMVQVTDPRVQGVERWLNVATFRGRFVKGSETIREYDNLGI